MMLNQPFQFLLETTSSTPPVQCLFRKLTFLSSLSKEKHAVGSMLQNILTILHIVLMIFNEC